MKDGQKWNFSHFVNLPTAMMKRFKQSLSRHLQNFYGKCLDRPVLIIESDDWGTCHIPSSQSFYALKDSGIPVDKSPYCTHDFLETQENLERLFSFLKNFRDGDGDFLKITANVIMANPDYEKIKQSGFEDYHFIGLKDTYKTYRPKQSILNLIMEGYDNKLFIPQFHGREHIHPMLWLQALREGHKETRFAFDNRVYGHPTSYFLRKGLSFASALQARDQAEMIFCQKSVKQGARMFNEVFGYKSNTFIAPKYIWPKELEPILYNESIRGIQGTKIQLEPICNTDKLKRRYHYTGQKSRSGITYLTRNVFFEPAQNPEFNWVADALDRINKAFYWKKPAIISSHRINFVNGIDGDNSGNNLELMGDLITILLKRYPDIKFMSSDELINYY